MKGQKSLIASFKFRHGYLSTAGIRLSFLRYLRSHWHPHFVGSITPPLLRTSRRRKRPPASRSRKPRTGASRSAERVAVSRSTRRRRPPSRQAKPCQGQRNSRTCHELLRAFLVWRCFCAPVVWSWSGWGRSWRQSNEMATAPTSGNFRVSGVGLAFCLL